MILALPILAQILVTTNTTIITTVVSTGVADILITTIMGIINKVSMVIKTIAEISVAILEAEMREEEILTIILTILSQIFQSKTCRICKTKTGIIRDTHSLTIRVDPNLSTNICQCLIVDSGTLACDRPARSTAT